MRFGGQQLLDICSQGFVGGILCSLLCTRGRLKANTARNQSDVRKRRHSGPLRGCIWRGKPLSISHMDGHRTRASELGPKRPGCQPQTCRPEAFTLRLKTLFTVMCFRDEVLCFFAKRPTARPKAKYFRLPLQGHIGLALVGEVQGFTCRRWANVCFRLGLRACSSPR